jgi:glutamate 5-kinase
MAGEGVSGLSKGGMITKVMAAKTATAGGCAMAITEGSVLRPISALENGANATWFTAQGTPHLARKRWIGSMKAQGTLVLDAGAVRALGQGKSLLPAGVTDVTGIFERGDPVSITDSDGHQLGQGLVAYPSSDAAKIKGHHSRDIEPILGYPGRTALIHRDDMAL